MPTFNENDLSPGDWIRYSAPTGGGVTWIAEVISPCYPFGSEPMADTTLGRVKLAAILEVRRHTCERDGRPKRVVDESTNVQAIRAFPTCSVCGKPQIPFDPPA